MCVNWQRDMQEKTDLCIIIRDYVHTTQHTFSCGIEKPVDDYQLAINFLFRFFFLISCLGKTLCTMYVVMFK